MEGIRSNKNEVDTGRRSGVRTRGQKGKRKDAARQQGEVGGEVKRHAGRRVEGKMGRGNRKAKRGKVLNGDARNGCD